MHEIIFHIEVTFKNYFFSDFNFTYLHSSAEHFCWGERFFKTALAPNKLSAILKL